MHDNEETITSEVQWKAAQNRLRKSERAFREELDAFLKQSTDYEDEWFQHVDPNDTSRTLNYMMREAMGTTPTRFPNAVQIIVDRISEHSVPMMLHLMKRGFSDKIHRRYIPVPSLAWPFLDFWSSLPGKLMQIGDELRFVNIDEHVTNCNDFPIAWKHFLRRTLPLDRTLDTMMGSVNMSWNTVWDENISTDDNDYNDRLRDTTQTTLTLARKALGQ